MKRVFAIVLSVIVLAVAFSGCGAAGKLRGTWQAEADISYVMQQILKETWPDSVYKVEDFQVTLELTFQKKGICTIGLQEGSMQEALDTLQLKMEQDFVDSLDERLTEMGRDVTIEELLKITGVNLETLLKNFRTTFKEAAFDEALRDAMRFDGYFEPDEEKLYISATEEIEEDTFAFQYQLEDGVLTMPMVYGKAPMAEEIPAIIAPLSFRKIN